LIGILNNSYSQRVTACFNLLDTNNLGYFTLSDFVERGNQSTTTTTTHPLYTHKPKPVYFNYKKQLNSFGLYA
jgi:hypothetical protein